VSACFSRQTRTENQQSTGQEIVYLKFGACLKNFRLRRIFTHMDFHTVVRQPKLLSKNQRDQSNFGFQFVRSDDVEVIAWYLLQIFSLKVSYPTGVTPHLAFGRPLPMGEGFFILIMFALWVIESRKLTYTKERRVIQGQKIINRID